jgi:long-chain acyl-CoA synthetase
MEVYTLADLVFRVREVSAGRPELLTVRHGDRRESLSATDFLRQIHSLALALEARGLEPGERVAIFSESRPEWQVADLACQLLGLVTVPIYPGSPPSQVAYVLRNSGARWIFYSDAAKRDLLLELQGGFTTPVELVAFDGDAAAPEGSSITRLLGEGAQRIGEVPIERFRGRVREEDLATILYTSGTTGDPKGVMLSHRNQVRAFTAVGEAFDLDRRDLALSFLPLSHALQRTLDHLCLARGVPIHYVPELEQVQKSLRRVAPTLLVALPGVYERLHARILAEAEGESAFRRWLFHRAVTVGRRHASAARSGVIGPFLALERRLAELLVFRRLRRRFGGRLRFAICGGGALAGEVDAFFEAVGLPLFQGYGLAEISPLVATNAPERQRRGSVGKVVPEVELRISEEGEVLVRGPGVMQGYWENPRATADSFDDSGWLRTGDLGRIDRSGYLFNTARKQDLLHTAGGTAVAPRPIEKLLEGHPGVARAVVVGDGHPRLGALLVPDRERLEEEAGELPAEGLDRHPEVRRRLGEAVAEVTAGLPEGERIGRFKVLDRDLDVEAGELTATGKLRRRVVNQRYAVEIAELCALTASSADPDAAPGGR